MTGTTDPTMLVLLAVGYYGLWALGRVRDRLDGLDWFEADDPDPLDQVHEAYETGEIDLQEFERQLDHLMDESNERIRDAVGQVEGVGETRAKEIAVSFRSVGHVARADRERLQQVPDVGETTADRVVDHFERDPRF